jgi:glycosyltransferase involved in cell wall biosynthesis
MDTFARYLVRHGHDVTVLSTLPAGGIAPVNGTVRHVLRRPLWTPAMGVARVRPEHMFGVSTYLDLQTLAADVVHSFFYTDSLAASLKRKKKGWRTVLHLNGIAIPGVSCRRFPPEAWLLRRAIDEANEFVVCSAFIAGLCAHYYGREPKVIFTPIEIEAWPIKEGPTDERPSILAAGDFDLPRKGARVLMKAFGLFKRKEPDAVLRFTGRLSPAVAGPLLATLPECDRESVELLGVGQAGDLPKLYQQASMLVLPAMWEPSGTVMLEAMASGTPVVATNHGGLPEYLTPEVSVLFEPEGEGEETNNYEGLAEAMRTALNLSRQPGVRERCRRRAKEFSTAVIGPVLENMYAER